MEWYWSWGVSINVLVQEGGMIVVVKKEPARVDDQL